MDNAIPPLQESERRPVTAVAIGVVNFASSTAGLDPEVVQCLSRTFEDVVRLEVERHGGVMEKLTRGLAVALFGVAPAHEDDPERAVRAALAIVTELGNVRAGVASAETLVRGGAEAGLGIAWGPVIEVATRLEAAAPLRGVLVDEVTCAATKDTVAYDEANADACVVRGLRISHARRSVYLSGEILAASIWGM